MARFLPLTVAFLFLFFLTKAEYADFRGGGRSFGGGSCLLSNWSKWSECTSSKNCGWGTRFRERRVKGGRCVTEKTKQKEDCNERPCPVDCVWAKWSQWGRCSATCGSGRKTSRRRIATKSKHGGKSCPGMSIRKKLCKIRSCPIHCIWGQWKKWGTCSATCGNGQKARFRSIARHARYGGRNCWGGVQRIQCKIKSCPVNCIWRSWGRWGTCTASCGNGQKARKRGHKIKAKYGGKSCPGKGVDKIGCKIRNCLVDCAWGNWGRWGTCTASCGNGKKSRTRRTARKARYGGKSCPGKGLQSATCKMRNCPIDCAWGIWGRWGKCSATCGLGRKTRTRGKARQRKYGGKRCPGKGSQTRKCITTRNCRVSCVWRNWGKWSACSATCGSSSKKARYRGIKTQARYGGKRCFGSKSQQVSCKRPSCPVHCVWRNWGKWSACSATCGSSSKKTRYRSVKTQARFGGKRCSGPKSQQVSCNRPSCSVHCVWRNWGKWAACSATCGSSSKKTRYRSVKTQARFGGKRCSGSKRQQISCNRPSCPVHCVWRNWGKWSACSATCGSSSKKTRYRSVKTQARYGGKRCSGSKSQQVSCNRPSCPVPTTFLLSISSSVVGMSPAQAHGTTKKVLSKSQSTSTQSLAEPITTNDKQSTTGVLIPGTTVAVTAEREQKLSTNTVKESLTTIETSDTTKTYTQPTTTPNFAITTTAIQTPESRIIHEQPTTGPKIHTTVQGIQKTSTTTANVSTLRTSIGLPETTKLSKQPEAYTKKHMIIKNCVWRNWGKWSACSATCGSSSKKSRYRSKKTRAKYGGKRCSGSKSQQVTCNRPSCPVHFMASTISTTAIFFTSTTAAAFGISLTSVPGSHAPAGAMSPTKTASLEIENFSQNRLESTQVSQSIVEKEVSSLPDSSTKTAESIQKSRETNGPIIEVPHVSTPEHPYTFPSTSPDLGTSYTETYHLYAETSGRSIITLTTSQSTTATTSTISTQKTTKSTVMAHFLSTTPIFPLSDAEAVIVTTIQSLGCTIILISLAVTLAVFLILRDFSYERFLHMNMEVALFLGHILVLTMRDITNMPTLCKIAGVGFQFFFLASFCFMLLEALQAYAIRTNVISYGGYCSRLQSFVIGWGMSGVITVVTAVIRHQEYVSDWSCWLNLGSSVVYASTGPVLILSAVTIITAEASGMGNYTALPDRNQDQFTAANANAKALFLILPLSTASWFVGLYAVYHANIALYSVVHALNVALGISIFVFHSLGNPKAHAVFKKLISRCC